jgi:hypothetical protein
MRYADFLGFYILFDKYKIIHPLDAFTPRVFKSLDWNLISKQTADNPPEYEKYRVSEQAINLVQICKSPDFFRSDLYGKPD